MKKEILVTGASGLVGSRFVELSPDYLLLSPNSKELSIADNSSVKEYFKRHQPSLILNFAAYTDVTAAENQTGDEKGLCWQINVVGVSNLLSTNIPFIQASTDMVFSGSTHDPGPYPENYSRPDSPDVLTWYGWTKSQAEELVLGANQTVVRIIYPVRSRFNDKLDYLRLPLSLFSAGKLYPLFEDQQVSFTFIDELAAALHLIIDHGHTGIFHVSSDTFSPYELVTYALERLGEDSDSVQSSLIKPFLAKQDNPYRYPVKGGLSTTQTEERLGMKFRSWQGVVDELIKQGLKV